MTKKEKSMQEKMAGKKAGGHADEKKQQDLQDPANGNNGNINNKTAKETVEHQNEVTPEVSLEEKSPQQILEEKLREKEEKYLRLSAEFDNYRKRTLREKTELIRLGGEEIITGLLPVLDDFDRAIDSMSNARDMDAMKKGMDLIYIKFKEFIKQKGVKEIQAMGTEFNTDLHEAITKIPATAKKDKGKIVDIIEKGYILHDKVIRYAKVVVGE